MANLHKVTFCFLHRFNTTRYCLYMKLRMYIHNLVNIQICVLFRYYKTNNTNIFSYYKAIKIA